MSDLEIQRTNDSEITPVDYARIEAIIDTAFEEFLALFGEAGTTRSGRVRQALENKAKNAIEELGVLTVANMGEAYKNSPQVFDQLNNVSGSQMIKILVEFGVIKPSAIPTTGPHAWPRQLKDFPWGATG